jgi:hypothetical protein
LPRSAHRSAAQNGLALTPPRYGIDFVDQVRDRPQAGPFARVAPQLSAPPIRPSQASTAVIQRRELPDGTPPQQLGDGDWLVSDRVHASVRWQSANLANLLAQRPHEYTQPHERRDFYLWFYNHTSHLGYEAHWPLAAYLVASGAARLSYGTPFDNEVQVAARRGNQLILDDVFPKLRDLLLHGPLHGPAAHAWDAQTLSDEQALAQSMYASTPAATVDQFSNYASQRGFLATAGSLAGFTQPHRGGAFHRVQDTPAFTGNIRSIEDRFDYGMHLATLFSTHPAPPGRVARPPAGASYTSGAEIARLDTRMGLHRLDAELDDFNVDEERVITIMQGLSADEQRELGYNVQRLTFLRSALDRGELTRALQGLASVTSEVRRALLP